MNKLTLEAMQNILSEVKKGNLERVAFKSGQLRQFFPRDWTVDQMKQERTTTLFSTWHTGS